MKKLDIKIDVLPAEFPSADAGSKGVFSTETDVVLAESPRICVVPNEDVGDAGSKGIFNREF